MSIPERRPHLAALDGIRGLAVAAVVVHHLRLPGLRGGWIGVDVFFALSGYLITTTLLRDGAADLGAFFRRRFWRLAPALAVLLACFVVVSLGADDRPTRLRDTAAAAGQVINVTMAGSRHGPFSDHLGHLWSLAAEAQFYVVWPLVLAWALRRGVGRRTLLLGLAVVFAAGAVERLVLVERGMPWNRLYFAPDTRMAGLVAGCIVALLHAGGAFERVALLRDLGRVGAVLGVAAVGVYLVAGPHFTEPAVYRWQLTAVAVAAAVAVASAATHAGGPLRPALQLAPLVWLGRASYSVYLWHVPLIAEVDRHRPQMGAGGRAVVVVPATIVIAWASYRWVERPFLGGRRPVEATGGGIEGGR